MNKGLSRLSIVFFILAGVVAYLLLNRTEDEGTLVGADRAFAVKNIDQVQKIFLADRKDGTTVLLERKNGYWLYNGKDRARPNAIENLLNAVENVQMKYKPSDAAIPFMLEDLSTQSIKVEVYGKGDELLKTYYVGGGTADERGTHIIMEDAEQPYVAHIPSWEGNIRFRYNLKGDDWRDRSIFATAYNDIEAVSIEYPKQRQHSFKLEKSGSAMAIKPFFELQKAKEEVPASASIESFLREFKGVGAENFRNNHPGQDSIRNTIPFSVITLKNKSGEEKKVSFYPIIPQNVAYETKTNQFQNINAAVERYWVDINGEDFLIAQHRVVKDVLWGYDFFFN